MTSQATSHPKVHCPAEKALAAIAGRWKLLILRELFSGEKRFGELQRALSGVTQKVLTQQLRELEADGLVHREIYAQVPPKVEYSLTLLGASLQPMINKMHEWGSENQPDSRVSLRQNGSFKDLEDKV